MTRNRIEVLAQELAAGSTVEAAMLEAGYAAETARQGRIQYNRRLVSPNNHPSVAARLDELRALARERSILTIGDIAEKFEEAFDSARANRNPSAMVAAAMGMAKVLGLIVERRHRAIKPIGQMNEQELIALLGENNAVCH